MMLFVFVLSVVNPDYDNLTERRIHGTSGNKGGVFIYPKLTAFLLNRLSSTKIFGKDVLCKSKEVHNKRCLFKL